MTGVHAGVLLAEALRARCEGRVSTRPEQVRREALAVGLEELSLQILALWPGMQVSRERVEALAQARPPHQRDVLLDVLSITEARQMLGEIDSGA